MNLKLVASRKSTASWNWQFGSSCSNPEWPGENDETNWSKKIKGVSCIRETCLLGLFDNIAATCLWVRLIIFISIILSILSILSFLVLPFLIFLFFLCLLFLWLLVFLLSIFGFLSLWGGLLLPDFRGFWCPCLLLEMGILMWRNWICVSCGIVYIFFGYGTPPY